MNTLLYDNKTLDLFKKLLHTAPDRIFSDEFYHVCFDYGENYILATPEDFIAKTQNESDEAITVKFVEHNSEYKNDENEKLIFEKKAITRLWILRTLLYFTDHEIYKNEAEALEGIDIEDEKNAVLKNLFRKSTGGHEEIVCQPKSAEAKKVNKKFANLVDAGIMLEIKDQYYLCASIYNAYSSYAQIITLETLQEDIADFYDFIELSF